jgi:hypothetical protein
MDPEFIFSSITMLAALFYIFKKSKHRRKILLSDLSNPFFMGNLIFVLLFCLYIFRMREHDEKTERLKEATKKGIFAIAIAYFSKVDLVITPFWIVWTAVYFSHGWV